MTAGIQVEGLSKRFGSRQAVQGLTFEVQPGEVFGLLGPNGAGKTTTVRMLAGLLSPTEGQARVAGLSVRERGQEVRALTGLLTEQPGLYDRLSGRENLLFYFKLYGLSPAQAWDRSRVLLQRFGLLGREDEPCGAYSKGMRQKLAIVRTLAHGPRVVFLDEPTSGLDPESAGAVREVIAELAAEGRTVLLCSHNLVEVERLCQRVAVIKGHLRALLSVKEMASSTRSFHITLAQPAERLVAIAQGVVPTAHVSAAGELLTVEMGGAGQMPELIAELVKAGARIQTVVPAKRALEEAYLGLVRQEGES